MTKISEKIIKSVIEDYNKGVPIKKICSDYKISRGSVTRITKECKRRRVNYSKYEDLDESVKKEIAVLIKKGLPYTEICGMYGIKRGNLVKLIKEENIKVPEDTHVTDNIKGIITDYNNGVPVKKIYDTYNVCSKSLYRILSLYNIPLRNIKRSKTDCLRKSILNDYINTDFSVRKIAEKYNVSVNVIYRMIQKAGVKYRRPKKQSIKDKKVMEECLDT